MENESDYGTMTRTEDSERSSSRLRVIYSTILLAALIIGLVGYKGYSGFSKLQQVRASGTLEIRDDLFRTGQGSTKFRFLVLSVKYLQIVWPALLFGVLTAAGVRAFVSPAWLVRVKGPVRAQIAAAMWAVLLFLCREALVEMDVPTRQSYVAAVVRPSERTVASGVTNLARNMFWALGSGAAGFLMQALSFSAPLLVGGAAKVATSV